MGMHDANGRFNTFYANHVVLPASEQTNLREKKDLNIERLESGLSEYNTDNGTTYNLIDHKVQGSMAMSTIVQNESNEYDIDVAIIFDKDNLPDGTQATKNMLVDALKRKTKAFKTEPEALTNAIRIEYADGYHIDFAVYRRYKNDSGDYEYEHSGSEWRKRNPSAITSWFKVENDASTNDSVRKVVRLLKMFCKSRSGWSMPGGLILSVLAAEQIQVKDRIDETFYETIVKIRDRLATNKEVYNPTDTSLSLLLTAKDHQKVKNLHTRLTTYIEKLSVLFETNCTNDKAYAAWKEFFNHSYWGEIISENAQNLFVLAKSNGMYSVEIYAEVEWGMGLRIPLNNTLTIPKGRYIYFRASPSFSDYQEIEWEVANTGDECGADVTHFQKGLQVREHTGYRGVHRMICKVKRYGLEICRNEVIVRVR